MSETDIAIPGPMLAGKRGLVMGVANDRSIAWGIARVLAGQGAELAFTYQGEAFGRRAVPLAESVGSKIATTTTSGASFWSAISTPSTTYSRRLKKPGAVSISSCMPWLFRTGGNCRVSMPRQRGRTSSIRW